MIQDEGKMKGNHQWVIPKRSSAVFEYPEQEARSQNLSFRHLLFPFRGSQGSSLRYTSHTQGIEVAWIPLVKGSFFLTKEIRGNTGLWPLY